MIYQQQTMFKTLKLTIHQNVLGRNCQLRIQWDQYQDGRIYGCWECYKWYQSQETLKMQSKSHIKRSVTFDKVLTQLRMRWMPPLDFMGSTISNYHSHQQRSHFAWGAIWQEHQRKHSTRQHLKAPKGKQAHIKYVLVRCLVYNNSN